MTREGTYQPDYYVAVDGDDRWSGQLESPNQDRSDGPFRSVQQARDAVRSAKEASERRDFVVWIRGGVHVLEEPIVFGLQDSAVDGHRVIYEAYPGEEPVFTSAVPIREWREIEERPPGLPELARSRVWVADLPEKLTSMLTLYDGGRRLPRARSQPFAVRVREDERNDPEAHTTLHFAPDTIRAWHNPNDVELIVRRWVFTMSILSLESIDVDSGTAKTNVAPYGRLLEISGARTWGVREGEPAIWVENVLEALDRPGEWVVDSVAGKVYLWPHGDKPGDNIWAPALNELVRVEGEIDYDGPIDTPVKGIVFRDLAFTGAERGKVQPGDQSIQHDWEMIDKADALVRFRGTEDCAVEACRFSNSGGSAVRLDLHCKATVVRNNLIEHLGGAGVLAIGYGPGTKDANGEHEIVNNHIHHIGEIYWHSHGVVLWQSHRNRVANNRIHHSPRKAICVTGVRPQFFSPDDFLEEKHPPIRENSPSIRWHEIKDADTVRAKAAAMPWEEPNVVEWPEINQYLHSCDNLIENNEIFRVGEIMADGSAINVSGAPDGNVVRRNFIHDLFGKFHGAIRTDDYQRKATFEENIILNTTCNGICTRHENYWINNIIADVRPGASIWVGERRFDGTVIRGNIMIQPSGDGTFYDFPTAERHHHYSDNVYDHLAKMEWGEINRNIYFQIDQPENSKELERLRELGRDKESVYADPLFADWKSGDFRFKPDSPAHKLGIREIDIGTIGLTTDFPKRLSEGE